LRVIVLFYIPLKLPKDPVLAMLGIASGDELKLKDYEEAVAKELRRSLREVNSEYLCSSSALR